MSALLHSHPCSRTILAAAGAAIMVMEAIKILAGVLG